MCESGTLGYLNMRCALVVILEGSLEKQSSFTFHTSFSLMNAVVCIRLLM